MSQNPFHAVSRDLHADSQELRECFHGLSTFEHQEIICATVLILFQSLSLPHTLYFELMFFKSCYWERVDSRSKWKHGSVAGIFLKGGHTRCSPDSRVDLHAVFYSMSQRKAHNGRGLSRAPQDPLATPLKQNFLFLSSCKKWIWKGSVRLLGHVGCVPVHFPFVWHVRVWDPTKL